MTFKRARSDQHVQERLNEIISAASAIYDSVGYEGLSFSEISKLTRFTRPTIYKYFKTKEEILLKILLTDMESWVSSLMNSFQLNKIYSVDEIASIWANVITKNDRILNLYAILFTLIEKNVSLESLVEFKKGMLSLQIPVTELLKQLFPKADNQDISDFIINQLALAQGLYPMSQLSELQMKAIELSGRTYTPPNFETSYKANVYQLMHCLEKGIRYPNKSK
ncbi:MAG: TetR family transcriptional regulator [Bacillota bacterium]